MGARRLENHGEDQRPTLFVIFASNASLAARLALSQKRIGYRRIDLPPVLHWGIVRALGFPRRTVPALFLGGRRVQGTREIVRALEAYRPDPPFFPRSADERRAVEDAELWGEQELQPVLRTLQPYALLHDRAAIKGLASGARLGIPPAALALTAWPAIRTAARVNGATEQSVRTTLRTLGGHLDRVDDWIARGVLGTDPPNAADIQIASTLRSLMWFDDLSPLIEPRPAGALALRLLPDVPGRIQRVFPADAVPAA